MPYLLRLLLSLWASIILHVAGVVALLLIALLSRLLSLLHPVAPSPPLPTPVAVEIVEVPRPVIAAKPASGDRPEPGLAVKPRKKKRKAAPERAYGVLGILGAIDTPKEMIFGVKGDALGSGGLGLSGTGSGVGGGGASLGLGGLGSIGRSSAPDRAFRVRVQAKARECYPELGGSQLSGTVWVRFCPKSSGREPVTLVHSSGAPALDAAALDCVARGVEIPPELWGCETIGIRFAP